MRIGELAQLTGVSIRSLRYYEDKKLISAVRSDNGYREFSLLAVEQVKAIRLYLDLGLSTEQIVSFLHCVMKNKEAFCQEIMPIYETKIQELDEQIRLFTMLRANLLERVHSIRQENTSLILE